MDKLDGGAETAFWKLQRSGSNPGKRQAHENLLLRLGEVEMFEYRQ